MKRNFNHEWLGKQLFQIRTARQIRQADLADLANLSRLTVRGIEKGTGNLSSFYRMLDVLGLAIYLPRCPTGHHIGVRLANLRQKRRVSQRALAAAISVSHPTIVKLEKYAQGRLSTLAMAFSFLGAEPKLVAQNHKQTFMEIASSRESDEWYSPASLLAKLTEAIGADFDLDPCSPTLNSSQAPVAAARYYTSQQDGLSMKWHGHVYMNPPYSRLKDWVKKARSSVEKGDTPLVVGLLPARTDTRWWNGYVAGHADVFFLQGRLTFLGHQHPAPFPSAVVVWGANPTLVESLKVSLDAFHMPAIFQGA